MKVTQRKNEDLYSEFAIEVPPAQVEAQIEQRLKELGKKVKVDGFRPGKAPMALLRQKYGENARAEAFDKVVEEAVRKTLKENNIKPAMRPQIDNVKFEDDNVLEFTMSVEKMPSFEPSDLKGLKLEKLVTKIDDKEIDEALTRVASGYKTTKPLETPRAAKMGDTVKMDFDGSSNGKKLPGMKAKDFELELGSNMFVDTFEEQLVGAKPGDKKLIKVKFPDDYRHPDLKGQQAEFDVDVKEVLESVPASVDDDLAKKAGMKSLDDLKAAIRNQMEREHNGLSRAKLKRALLDLLDQKNKFAVPKGMIDAEYEQIWQYHLQDLKARNMDLAAAEKDEDSKKEFREIAERRVRLGLLMSEIGERNKITVTNQEINQAVMREAYNYPGQEEQVIKFYQKNPQAVASLRAPIYEEKVTDYILSQIQLDEKNVSKEELMHDPDEEKETARASGKAKKK